MSVYLHSCSSMRVLLSTLARVIQREDCKNRKKRLAPPPTALDKTSTGSYGVSFCSLLQYNLRHRGDFLISVPFLRNSTPNTGGGHPLGRSKNPPFGVYISWTEAKLKNRLGGVNCIDRTYWMIPYTTMWLWQHELQGGVLYLFRNLHVVFNVRV